MLTLGVLSRAESLLATLSQGNEVQSNTYFPSLQKLYCIECFLDVGNFVL